MNCDVCTRSFDRNHRKPLCASCARASVYEQRYLQASALFDREKSHTQAEAVIRPYNDGVLAALPADVDLDLLGESSKKFNSEQRQAEQHAIDERVCQIHDKAQVLREQIRECRDYIVAQQESAKQRRKDLAQERVEMETYKPRLLEPVQLASSKTSQRLQRVHNKIVDARFLLCREAASASNLQRRKTWNGKAEYRLGDVAIPDLRELNLRTQALKNAAPVGSRTIAEPHDLVSGALESVARLINLCSHYLHIRVPAEIVLPHDDFPRAVVMPEKASYKLERLPFPGPPSSQSTSPTASRIVDRKLPRPRPLYLDRPLAQLLKDDPKAYGLFVEGITLLAWDLAWLCKTQGIDNINTFEDVCAVGRNLWQLFDTPPRKPSEKAHRDRTAQTPATKNDGAEGRVHLGSFSHDSVTQNLSGVEGLKLMRDWPLASSARLTDLLKSYLVNEMSGAEWDLLEEREWDEEREDEKPVMVGGSRRPQESRHPAMSIMSVAPHEGGDDDEQAGLSDAKRKGNSGWMKVRGRGGDGA